jgi:hypothetical protein
MLSVIDEDGGMFFPTRYSPDYFHKHEVVD